MSVASYGNGVLRHVCLWHAVRDRAQDRLKTGPIQCMCPKQHMTLGASSVRGMQGVTDCDFDLDLYTF